MAHACRTCCSRFHSCSFRLWMSVSCASCSASTLFASCSACSPFSYFWTASCQEQKMQGLHLTHNNVWNIRRGYLSEGLHLLDLGVESGFHAPNFLLAALQLFPQLFQTLPLLCQSVLLLLQLCRVNLQFSLFLQHPIMLTCAEASLLNFVPTAVCKTGA